jgi:hypothetical protein
MPQTREEKNAYMRGYYARNREAKRAKDQAYYERTREERLAYQREYYRNNKAKVTEREARYRREAAEIIAEARKQPCADCGGTFPPSCMQFHHVDPTTKEGDVRAMGHPTRVKREMAKCVVICANCHCIRHGDMA